MPTSTLKYGKDQRWDKGQQYYATWVYIKNQEEHLWNN